MSHFALSPDNHLAAEHSGGFSSFKDFSQQSVGANTELVTTPSGIFPSELTAITKAGEIYCALTYVPPPTEAI